jgi:hypothetical protein
MISVWFQQCSKSDITVEMFLAVIIPGDSYFWVVNKSIAAIWCFIQGSCSFRYMLEVNDQQTRRSNQTDGKIFNQAE